MRSQRLSSQQIREAFLRFFEERGHRVMPGIPLVPRGDPTLLFTSAGMVPFKPYFLGLAEPPARRLTSVQKCFRATDIDAVGDACHLTFFEMLGNFSVGDPYGRPPVAAPGAITGDRPYFKAEAIAWAWEFVTEVLRLPPGRLWVAVYADDDEAYGLWRDQGLSEGRIARGDERTNYWFSGEVGPCGPCSEIHFDLGPELACGPDCCPTHTRDCGRFLEIWNLVFMSYFQHEDGSRTPLPTKNIDTGAGLERLAAAAQGCQSVYETDLFQPIIDKVAELCGQPYDQADAAAQRAMRIVAEHTRAAAFLIADGVAPSNEGRGYVLRRVLRRAAYFVAVLGRETPILDKVAIQVVNTMAEPYGELTGQTKSIADVIKSEERKFGQTLERGRAALTDPSVGAPSLQKALRINLPVAYSQRGDLAMREIHLERIPGLTALPHALARELLSPHRVLLGPKWDRWWLADRKVLEMAAQIPLCITGRALFILWDTYGFPPELTKEVASQVGFSVAPDADAEFERLLEKQRERARAAGAFGHHRLAPELYAALSPTAFLGYEALACPSTVLGLVVEGEAVERAEAGQAVEVILRETPFYAEAGGQVGDRGEIVGPAGRVTVQDTQRIGSVVVHRGQVAEGSLAVGDPVTARVDEAQRLDTMRNHTATHLLHAALRRVLGPHVRQGGSLVAPDRLRFDFTHVGAHLDAPLLGQVQALVNEKLRQDLPVRVREALYAQALEEGVLAFFDEAYGDTVRVVEVREDGERFSAELCGGTHCQRTGEIGLCLIVDEGSVGAGLRRIEALTGRGAEAYVEQQRSLLLEAGRRLAAPPEGLAARIGSLQQELEEAQRRLEVLERELGRREAERLVAQAQRVGDARVVAAPTSASSPKALRELGDMLREGLGSAVIVLAAGRQVGAGLALPLLAMVTPDLVERGLRADQILQRVTAITGGGGGGTARMAQGGGSDPGRLEEALAAVLPWVREHLSR